nr:MAG TPA: hypothetical protein [Caudoviricetes sp.]
MATIDLTKTELTEQDREEIRNEVTRFERLYQGRYGALTPLQRANLTHAFQYAVEAGIGLDNSADSLMAWGEHTESTLSMLETRGIMERLLFDYDGDHKDLDAYIHEIYSRYFNVDDAQALRFVDTKAFKEELEHWGWCFTPSLDGTVYHVFND